MKNLYIFCLLLLPGIVAAQITPNTEGFFLSAGLSANSISYDDDNIESASGGGLDLRLGYGISPLFTAFVGITGARVEGNQNSIFPNDYGLSIFELGGRFHFGRKIKSPVFYADVSLQGAAASQDNENNFGLTGGGMGLGLGIMAYTGPRFAIDLGLRTSFGRINEITFDRLGVDISDQELNYGIGRLTVAATWFL